MAWLNCVFPGYASGGYGDYSQPPPGNSYGSYGNQSGGSYQASNTGGGPGASGGGSWGPSRGQSGGYGGSQGNFYLSIHMTINFI